jgi:hypothetical protein
MCLQRVRGELCLYLYQCAHRELKNKWGKETHIDISARNEVAGIVSLKKWIWNLRGPRQGFVGGRCSLYLGGKNVEHTFEKEKAKRKFIVCSKFWLTTKCSVHDNDNIYGFNRDKSEGKTLN